MDNLLGRLSYYGLTFRFLPLSNEVKEANLFEELAKQMPKIHWDLESRDFD
ncbi:hypothetical protein [Acetivibrio cellulolyticus]